MQSIKGKNTVNYVEPLSVRCFFIPGWEAQFCSNHFDSLYYRLAPRANLS